MASSVNTEETKSVSNLFDEGFLLFNAINETNEATNSGTVQSDIKKAIKIFEDCTRLVSMANVFSTNESIEELPPNDLKFLLLPALLGMLHLKICGGDRKELVNVAEVYFKDYLKRCYQYGLTECDPSNEINGKKNDNQDDRREKTEGEIIAEIVNRRSEKIKRFKEQKALEEKIKYLKENLVDDEIKRDFYITLLKSFIYQAVDEIKSLEMEKPMLEMFQQRNKAVNQPNKVNKSEPPHRPLKPVIITRDEVQKAVYGAGYPSLPVMTVKEFYDQRVAEGIFPDPSKQQDKPLTLQEMAALGITPDSDEEEKEKEEKIEKDDPELLERLRKKDEMKDEFRRGWGNRMNRS